MAKVKNNQFIEYVNYSNDYYGTSIESVNDVQNQGKICILDLELNGVINLKKSNLNPRFVFVKPPGDTIEECIKVLRTRLIKRGSENVEQIETRMKYARELLNYAGVDGNFDCTIVTDVIVIGDNGHGYDYMKNFIMADVDEI